MTRASSRVGVAVLVALLGIACGDDDTAETTGAATVAEGIPGKDGVDGRDGADGRDGKDGDDGDDGAPGADGEDGENGADGLNGADGAPGADGADGLDGLDGADGEDGEDGRDGRDGLDGRDGRDGEDGIDGQDGEDGDPGVDEELPAAPEPQRIPLSLTGHDRFYGVAYGADGSLFVTGQISNGTESTADYSLMVAKFAPGTTELEASFGNSGVAVVNVTPGGTSREIARGIVVQASGKIVIAGAAEHDVTATGVYATDTDIVLVRFNANGSLDGDFGTGGIVRLDLTTGVPGLNNQGVEVLVAGDTQYALALAQDDKLVVHGTVRAEGFQSDGVTPRNDADWALVRLTADGVLDDTFSGDGLVTLDIGGAGASARTVTVLADDSIIGTGYLSSEVLGQSTQQPVLYKVTADGTFDATFATNDVWDAPGVWHDIAVTPPLRAEAYGAAVQGDQLVTMGYGPTTGTGTGSDWISFRFDMDGDRDLTYGTSGATYVDAGGYSDNGRFVMVLPDNRVVGIGGGRPTPATPPAMDQQPPSDGMIAVLNENGSADTTFGPQGFQLYDLGGTNDFFWAGALSPDEATVAVVGIAGSSATGAVDEDGALYLMPVE